MTGRGGMKMIMEALKEQASTSVTCTTTMQPKEISENPKINLENMDFSRIFALETKF